MSGLSDFCGTHSLVFRPPVVRTDSAPNPLSNNETSKIGSLHETKPVVFYNDTFMQNSALGDALDNHEVISEETCTSYFSDEVHTLSEPSLPNDEYLCADATESFPISLDSGLHTQALYAVTISDTEGFNLDSGAFNSSTSFMVGTNSGLSFVDLEPNSHSDPNCSEAHYYCNPQGETVQPFASEFCPTFQPYVDEPFVVQNSECTYPTTLSTALTTEQNYFSSHNTTQNPDFRCCVQSAVVNSMVAGTSREKDAMVSAAFSDPIGYCLTSGQVSTDRSHYDQPNYDSSAYNKFAGVTQSAPAMKNDHTVMCCQGLPSQDVTNQYYDSNQYSVYGPCQFTEQTQSLDQYGSDTLPSQLHNDPTPAFYYNTFDNFSSGNSLDKLQNSVGLSRTLQRSPHENLGISEFDYWVTDGTDPTVYKQIHSYTSLSNLDHWSESAHLTDEGHCNLDRTKQDMGPSDPRPGELCVPHFSDGASLIPAHPIAHVPSESLPPLQPHPSYAIEHSLNPTEATLGNRTCPHCTHTFIRPSHLEAHLRIHTSGGAHRCVLCGRQFTQASNLRRHLSSHKTWPPIPPGKRSTGRVWVPPAPQVGPICC
ncbi:hypothetical protein P879_06277 [Paragonimus westermani]|uniref:C2H2-type domain-containing protein n=1 Tax=Paragonimus westermani TaxID=34504 RepID=A0A8T0DLU2_9TREM|nr:hypothetical protein P879_06277 [Paragonimus westermani]